MFNRFKILNRFKVLKTTYVRNLSTSNKNDQNPFNFNDYANTIACTFVAYPISYLIAITLVKYTNYQIDMNLFNCIMKNYMIAMPYSIATSMVLSNEIAKRK